MRQRSSVGPNRGKTQEFSTPEFACIHQRIAEGTKMPETTTAVESKIEATHRLRTEERWAAASVFKDEMIAELRGRE